MSDVSADLSLDVGAGDGGIVADLLGKIHLGINDATVEMRKANRLEQRRLAAIPNSFTKSLSSQVTGTDTLIFGGPQNGRQWEVRLLFGMDTTLAANAAVVTWYVGQDVRSTPTSFEQSSMGRWQFASLPGQKDFGSGQITLQPNEVLIAQITGAPAGKIIALNVSIDDMVQDDSRYTVSLS
jgi:hypothetical protein